MNEERALDLDKQIARETIARAMAGIEHGVCHMERSVSAINMSQELYFEVFTFAKK